MIGFYDYTVWLTYISLMTSVYGILCSFGGNVFGGVICLALSGFFDAFDGMIARTKKNRTDMQKAFGIQIDSLSDLVCFGVGPAAIGYAMGLRSAWGIALLLAYCTAGLIRLAYFNVTEEQRQKETTEKRRYYQGLPITAAATIFPVFYMCTRLFSFSVLPVLAALLALTGLLFILDIKIPKPGVKAILAAAAVVAAFGAAAWLKG